MAKRSTKGLYKNHPVHGRIPNWKQVIRCQCCARIYRARLLEPEDIDAAQYMDDDLVPHPARILHVGYAECPHCYSWHDAQFSNS